MRRIAFALSSLLVVAACDEKEDAPTGIFHDAPTTGGPDAATSGSQPDSGTASNELSCTTATLFAGDPVFAGESSDNPPDGTGLLEDPPFNFRTVLFSNGHLISHDGQEIWQANLADGKLHKIAGSEGDQLLVTGACAAARFANVNGLALAPDGSIFIIDQTANTVLKMTDPLGQGCTVSHYAGTPTDITDPIDFGNPPNVGSDDGAGSAAKFGLPERGSVDAAGNLYVWDPHNDAIRKIANDGNHTVSTVLHDVTGEIDGVLVTPLVVGGTLYIYGQNADQNAFMTSLDLASGNHHAVFTPHGGVPFGGDSSDSPVIGGITSDGTNAIVLFSGRVFSISPTGTIHGIAGVYGDFLEFDAGYDPKASHPAAEMQIPNANSLNATAGANAWLTIDAQKNIYISTEAGHGHYIEKVACH